MSTIGWFFILVGVLVIRQVAKGRVMETPDDLADAFLAIVSGDTKGLNAVLARTGEFNKPDQGEVSEGTGDAPLAPVEGKYKLGKVQPHVARVANTLGPMFGIKTVGGWRAVGSVPGSFHPKGRALDFMINNIPNGHAVGEKLAAYAVANASTLGIIEVIWNKRIWSASKGWRSYSGPSDHTDHVHLSFANNFSTSADKAALSKNG